MKSKFKIEKARSVTDFIGKDVSPGNVIAVSRSGRRSKGLEAYIVTAIRKEALILADYQRWTANQINPAATRSYIDKTEWQDHIVLLENPLFALDNPQIKKLLIIADFLKDANIFGQDYVLGRTVLE